MKNIKYYHFIFILLTCTVQSQTVLEFSYDNAGNQMLRDEASTTSRNTKTTEDLKQIASLAELPIAEIIANKFTASPNPTSGEVVLSWESDIAEEIRTIELVSIVTSETKTIKYQRGNEVSINLYGKPSGLYMVIFHLNNIEVPNVQKKIVKL